MKTNKIIICTSSREVVEEFIKVFDRRGITIMEYKTNNLGEICKGKHGIQRFRTDKGIEFSKILRNQSSDSLCISCFTSYIFKNQDINYFDRPIINLHTGKIPSNRGKTPLFWDIVEQQNNAYATLHTITEQIDMGSILETISIPILEKDDPKTLASKLLKKVFKQKLFEKWLGITRKIIENYEPVKEQGKYKKGFKVDDKYISKEKSAEEILRLWKCYRIWGVININGKYYKDISKEGEADDEIKCKCGNKVYGLVE